jgi:hypothetical protein
MSDIRIIKADGEKEFFDRNKLVQSLSRSGASRDLAEQVALHVEKELINDMSTSDIYRHAFELLRQSRKPVAARYSLRRALVDLGPTGFPFEEYVGEIFKAKGFSVETGKMVQGVCVPHEVDLIAWNENKLIMGEVKFHNEFGLKSDLKVALYVKARFDDIRGNSFLYGDKARTLDEGWLITNTKFTERAVQYAKCAGLHLLGWSYPHSGNLQELIESQALHPISILTTLSNSQKVELYNRKVVLCRVLKENPSLLEGIGLGHRGIEEAKSELAEIC